MKKFYKTATAEAAGDQFAILLDGRAAKTPLRAPLAAPNAKLAEALAAEWNDQGETIDPLAMPLTRIACAAIDHMGEKRAIAIDGLLAYGETDLVCYRAERPQSLIDRQDAAWGPILAWAAEVHDAPLRVVTGIAPVAQPAQAMTALRAALETYQPFRLAGLSAAVEGLGSLLLALALADDRLDAAAAFAAARVDDDHQIEHWGEDEDAAARAATQRLELDAAALFLNLTR